MYVFLDAQNLFYDGAGGGQFRFDASVQNLTAETMGTTDGTNYDGTGVEVFFDVEPAIPVTLNNASCCIMGTASGQSFFQYPQLVPANGTTAWQPWIFDEHGGGDFTFIVYVSVALPIDPNPVVIPPHEFAQISTGSGGCALRSGGRAYCWGNDAFGQLGDGVRQLELAPVAMIGGHQFDVVSAGFNHACGIDLGSGRGYCWGDNSSGQLGDLDSTTRGSPTAVGRGMSFSAISSGFSHSCGIERTSGDTYCWGDDASGQLGGNGGVSSVKPIPLSPAPASPFVSVVSGRDHSCGLTGKGEAYCWGANSNGQLGDGTTMDREKVDVVGDSHVFTALFAGGNHTCGIDGLAQAWCWGSDTFGELGDGGTTDQSLPVAVSKLATALRSMALGDTHTCGVDLLDLAWCWGSNGSGELGDGGTSSSATPVAVADAHAWSTLAAGSQFTCGIDLVFVAWCWGAGDQGQIGDGALVGQLTPTATLGSTASAIMAGGAYACAISDVNDQMQCWGGDTESELGDGFLLVQFLPRGVLGDLQWSTIVAGLIHTCALDGSGTAFCWGDNSLSQLGNGSPPDGSAIPVPVAGGDLYDQISTNGSGGHHTCALLAGLGDREARCWGSNGAGQIGDGSTSDASKPTSPSGLTFNSISAGDQHSCALQRDGTAYCWGDNSNGQLGDGTKSSELKPSQILGFAFAAIVAGNQFSCGIEQATLEVYCWGINTFGQLGDGTTVDHAKPVPVKGGLQFSAVALGASHACALEAKTGAAYCWGYNGQGELGDGTTADELVPVAVTGGVTTFSAISAGTQQTCAITSKNVPYCWGFGGAGAIGDGTGFDFLEPTLVRVP